MKKNKILAALLLSTLFQTNLYALSKKQIDTLAHDFMKQNQVEGMSIAVLKGDQTQIYNYGFANKEKQIPTSSETIYTIASFTKTITATLAAIAATEQKLDLDAPFINYVPELKKSKNLENITISQLLGHVSSFPFDFEPRPKTYSAIIQDLQSFTPNKAPGSEYQYSNVGIGTVGYILEHAYRKDYQTILETKLLKPLKMTSTYLVVPADKEKHIAVGHDQSNKVVAYNPQIEAWFAAASLKSTITDMAKYLSAHMNYLSLDDKNLLKAIPIVHENRYCFADKLACEQLAWQAHIVSELEQAKGDTQFTHFAENGMPVFGIKSIVSNPDFTKNKIFIDKTGSGYGMSSYMVYRPDEKIGVVILLNKWIGDERIKLARQIISEA